MVYFTFFIFIVFISSLLSLNTLFLGALLLLFCLLIFFVLAYMNLTWFGLLFFLIYVGGLLVLFFYIFSLKSKPMVLDHSLFKLLFVGLYLGLFVLFLGMKYYFSLDYVFRNLLEDLSFSLFNSKEYVFVLGVGIFLLFALFVVKKLTSDVKAAVRPVKF